MSENEVRRHLPGLYGGGFTYKAPKSIRVIMCETKYEGDSDQCQATIANQRIRKGVFTFSNNHLIGIGIIFDESYYQTVFEGLTSKYGKPAKLQELSLKNNLTGVSSTHNEALWMNNSHHALAIQNHSIAGSYYRPEGFLSIVDSTYAQELRHGEKADEDDL